MNINSGILPWTIEIILPKHVYFRRPLSENSRLSIGTAFDTENFYTHTNSTIIKGTYNYSRNEFKTSLVYERYLGNGLAAIVNTGVVNIFNSRLTKKGEPQNHNAANVTQDICGYANIGISYNP